MKLGRVLASLFLVAAAFLPGWPYIMTTVPLAVLAVVMTAGSVWSPR